MPLVKKLSLIFKTIDAIIDDKFIWRLTVAKKQKTLFEINKL
jgi:hypothetical protein